MPEVGDTWHRFEEVVYSSGLDEFENPLPGPGTVDLRHRTFRVAKVTKCGVRLYSVYTLAGNAPEYGDPGRFVLLKSKKRYACPTVEEALESFIARKKRQASIFQAKMDIALKASRLAEAKLNKKPSDTLFSPYENWEAWRRSHV